MLIFIRCTTDLTGDLFRIKGSMNTFIRLYVKSQDPFKIPFKSKLSTFVSSLSLVK